MRIIAHRGNLNGPSASENSPEKLQEAILEGFDVEMDIWYKDGLLWSGHDRPEYLLDLGFLRQHHNNIWFHCKNIEAAEYLSNTPLFAPNFFSHDSDDFVITSFGYIWAFPGHKLTKGSVCVMPEASGQEPIDCFGVCTDYPYKYKRP
jgi:hypothetical protein